MTTTTNISKRSRISNELKKRAISLLVSFPSTQAQNEPPTGVLERRKREDDDLMPLPLFKRIKRRYLDPLTLGSPYVEEHINERKARIAKQKQEKQEHKATKTIFEDETATKGQEVWGLAYEAAMRKAYEFVESYIQQASLVYASEFYQLAAASSL